MERGSRGGRRHSKENRSSSGGTGMGWEKSALVGYRPKVTGGEEDVREVEGLEDIGQEKVSKLIE